MGRPALEGSAEMLGRKRGSERPLPLARVPEGVVTRWRAACAVVKRVSARWSLGSEVRRRRLARVWKTRWESRMRVQRSGWVIWISYVPSGEGQSR